MQWVEATLLGSLVDLWNLLLSDVSPRAPRWAGDKTTHLSPMSETGGATSHPVPPGLFGLNMAWLLGIFGSITPSQQQHHCLHGIGLTGQVRCWRLIIALSESQLYPEADAPCLLGGHYQNKSWLCLQTEKQCEGSQFLLLVFLSKHQASYLGYTPRKEECVSVARSVYSSLNIIIRLQKASS